MNKLNKWWIFLISVLVFVGMAYLFLGRNKNRTETSSAASDGENSSVVNLDWDTLRVLNVTSNDVPQSIEQINGNHIKLPGFMIPLEDNQNVATEFLFVPSPMACIHVPPPPPNQTIHVKMASGKIAKVSYGPVWLYGTFIVEHNESGDLKSSYNIVGSKTEAYY